MTDRLRVLIVGDRADDSPCDTYRGGMLALPLAALGVDLGYASPSIIDNGPIDSAGLRRLEDEALERLLEAAVTADVIVFRRFYATTMLCLVCGFAAIDPAEAAAHSRATGHPVNAAPSAAARALFDRVELDPAFARDHAIVYETDDDLLSVEADNAISLVLAHEQDLTQRMIRRADLVTTSTTVLADRLARLAVEVRLVRNAVNPDWYPFAPSGGERPQGRARVMYYGSLARMKDYAVCRASVDALPRSAVRRVWLGAPKEFAAAAAARQFDEVHPFVVGAAAFARRLADLRPDIGLAPIVGTNFDRAKSELHWLEYTMAGAATVASTLAGGGPYDVIRNGIDGILATGPDGWRSALRRMAASRDLRAELAGRARERVLAEYTVATRAETWAGAFRDASEHRGRGLQAAQGARHEDTGARRPAPASGGQTTATDTPEPAVAVATPDPGTILAAYVAAAAFAGRSPLRLRVCRGGSPARTEHPADDDWITVDTAGTPDLLLDVLYGLPFADGSVDALDVEFAMDGEPSVTPILLVEAHRVLRPDAALRIIGIDRQAALARLRLLETQGLTVVGDDARLPVHDRPSLRRALLDAGFTRMVDEAAPGAEVRITALR